ncbi:hypothetical protein HPB51_011568 [Rhipicephalus microplus]|uniref:Uncharacterized protein n=1 Tax=Rhipicephalus microplus TaxID=6941 RepID=A0A9J6EFZ9_RHIMP|nr:hypothetical protein HPB51_011568 [Rhipicephalus microplus]
MQILATRKTVETNSAKRTALETTLERIAAGRCAGGQNAQVFSAAATKVPPSARLNVDNVFLMLPSQAEQGCDTRRFRIELAIEAHHSVYALLGRSTRAAAACARRQNPDVRDHEAEALREAARRRRQDPSKNERPNRHGNGARTLPYAKRHGCGAKRISKTSENAFLYARRGPWRPRRDGKVFSVCGRAGAALAVDSTQTSYYGYTYGWMK